MDAVEGERGSLPAFVGREADIQELRQAWQHGLRREAPRRPPGRRARDGQDHARRAAGPGGGGRRWARAVGHLSPRPVDARTRPWPRSWPGRPTAVPAERRVALRACWPTSPPPCGPGSSHVPPLPDDRRELFHAAADLIAELAVHDTRPPRGRRPPPGPPHHRPAPPVRAGRHPRRCPCWSSAPTATRRSTGPTRCRRCSPTCRATRDVTHTVLDGAPPRLGARASCPSRRVVDALWLRAEGNPLFLTELLRHVGTDLPTVDPRTLPQSVDAGVARRLARMDAGTRQLLAVASIIGPEFSLDTVARTGEVPPNRLLAAADEAVAEEIIEPTGEPNHYRFVHEAVRSAVEHRVAPNRGVHVHGRLADRARGRPAGQTGADDHLVRLAFHAAAASPVGGSVTAATHAGRAGDQAMAQLAFDEAAEWYGVALGLLGGHGRDAAALKCRLLVSLGDAHDRAGEKVRARHSFLEAVAVAHTIGDQALISLAEAALGRSPWPVPLDKPLASKIPVGVQNQHPFVMPRAAAGQAAAAGRAAGTPRRHPPRRPEKPARRKAARPPSRWRPSAARTTSRGRSRPGTSRRRSPHPRRTAGPRRHGPSGPAGTGERRPRRRRLPVRPRRHPSLRSPPKPRRDPSPSRGRPRRRLRRGGPRPACADPVPAQGGRPKAQRAPDPEPRHPRRPRPGSPAGHRRPRRPRPSGAPPAAGPLVEVPAAEAAPPAATRTRRPTRRKSPVRDDVAESPDPARPLTPDDLSELWAEPDPEPVAGGDGVVRRPVGRRRRAHARQPPHQGPPVRPPGPPQPSVGTGGPRRAAPGQRPDRRHRPRHRRRGPGPSRATRGGSSTAWRWAGCRRRTRTSPPSRPWPTPPATPSTAGTRPPTRPCGPCSRVASTTPGRPCSTSGPSPSGPATSRQTQGDRDQRYWMALEWGSDEAVAEVETSLKALPLGRAWAATVALLLARTRRYDDAAEWLGSISEHVAVHPPLRRRVDADGGLRPRSGGPGQGQPHRDRRRPPHPALRRPGRRAVRGPGVPRARRPGSPAWPPPPAATGSWRSATSTPPSPSTAGSRPIRPWPTPRPSGAGPCWPRDSGGRPQAGREPPRAGPRPGRRARHAAPGRRHPGQAGWEMIVFEPVGRAFEVDRRLTKGAGPPRRTPGCTAAELGRHLAQLEHALDPPCFRSRPDRGAQTWRRRYPQWRGAKPAAGPFSASSRPRTAVPAGAARWRRARAPRDHRTAPRPAVLVRRVVDRKGLLEGVPLRCLEIANLAHLVAHRRALPPVCPKPHGVRPRWPGT